MPESDQRHISRDSLFMLAGLRVNGRDLPNRVKIRNLSAGGLMAEGDVRVVPGVPVAVELRNVGWVDGAVAWVQDNRFGIAFEVEIDPKAVRAGSGPADNGFVPMRPPLSHNANPAQLRKI